MTNKISEVLYKTLFGIAIKQSNKIKELEEEKLLLLKQIEQEAVAQKPVVIPLEVAEAIEYYKSSGKSDIHILGIMFGINYREGLVYASNLMNYRESGGGINIANALINGYTIETLESKIKVGVKKLCAEWVHIDGDIDGEKLSERISEFVSQTVREDQAATQQ